MREILPKLNQLRLVLMTGKSVSSVPCDSMPLSLSLSSFRARQHDGTLAELETLTILGPVLIERADGGEWSSSQVVNFSFGGDVNSVHVIRREQHGPSLLRLWLLLLLTAARQRAATSCYSSNPSCQYGEFRSEGRWCLWSIC